MEHGTDAGRAVFHWVGRTRGMPIWSGLFTGDQFKSILAFLHSVQEEH